MTNRVELYRIPLEVAEILDSSVLERYNDSLKPLNATARKTLGKFQDRDGKLAGSSPLM